MVIWVLPSAVGKRILSYLPRANLGDYARVNKYWAYLVDDFKAELVARQKINADLNRLQELMLRHDTSVNDIALADRITVSNLQGMSAAPTRTKLLPRLKTAADVTFKYMQRSRCPRKLSELTDRLERRGAADENIWIWCQNSFKHVGSTRKLEKLPNEGQLPFALCPCPLMKMSLDIPIQASLIKNPAILKYPKSKTNVPEAMMLNGNEPHRPKLMCNLWTKHFSRLYPVFTIPFHQCPV